MEEEKTNEEKRLLTDHNPKLFITEQPLFSRTFILDLFKFCQVTVFYEKPLGRVTFKIHTF
jgi:hypothetical protein